MVCSGEAPPHLKSLRRLEPFFIRVGRVPTILKTSKPFEKTGRGTVRRKAHDELNLLTSARRGARMHGGSADALLHGCTDARKNNFYHRLDLTVPILPETAHLLPLVRNSAPQPSFAPAPIRADGTPWDLPGQDIRCRRQVGAASAAAAARLLGVW